MDQCRNRRSELLQQFARLEIALKQRLKAPHKSFGSKMKAWIKDEPENTKGFDRLINARILVAHAYVRPLQHEGTTYLLWELAEGKCELNCAKFDKPALKAWADELDSLLKQAIAAATA